MANGNYGNIRPADVNISDMEVFLHYTPSRGQVGDDTLTKLDANSVILEMNNPNNSDGFEVFGGLYTLKLPSTTVNKKGIFTIIIKPKEIRTKILDVGVLSAISESRGLVFDLSEVSSEDRVKFQNDGLVGYRVEYLNSVSDSDKKLRNLYRIITSNNKVDAVSSNQNNTSNKSIRYVYNDNSTLVFATVTPNATFNNRPNILPFIGSPNQDVIISNTFFTPVMIELEMVEHDAETLAYGLYGNQTKSIQDGIYTIYNFDNEIYKQYNLFEVKDEFGTDSLFEVKESRTNIDLTKNFNNIGE